MAEALPKVRLTSSVHSSAHSGSSTNDAFKLHNLIDLTCGKINELKKLISEECDILRQDFSDELMEPILARQDHVIQRAMRCIQAQQKAAINGEQHFGSRKNERRTVVMRNSSAETNKPIPQTSSESKSQLSVFDESDSVNPMKEKKKWRLGIGKDKKKETTIVKQSSTPITNPVEPASSLLTQSADMKGFENSSAWYGSLDRNVVKKKKRSGLDKSRRHTKTVGSMAGLDIVERCEKLKPDEQYEIGLPSVSIHSRSGQLSGTQSPHKHRPPLPSPYQPENQDPPPRPLSKKDAFFASNLIKEQPIKTISPIDHNFGSHMSIPIQPGFNKNVPIGAASPDWFRSSTMSKINSLSKSWYETNLDDGHASSQSTLSLSSRSVLASEPSSSLSIAGLDSTDGAVNRLYIASPGTDISEKSSKSSDSETRCSFTNESSKPFEMSDYYKYSTKFRIQNSSSSLASQDNVSTSSKRLANSYGDTSHPPTGRVVALNVNDELHFATVENNNEKVDDANGNYFPQEQPVPKLPPKQHGRSYATPYNAPREFVMKHLEAVDGSDMAWFLDTDPPTFV